MEQTINLKLEHFEGPLDLLMHLINKNKIDIYDIPIVQLTSQYMDYINTVKPKDLDVLSEFLVMAATLLEIKSKMLLPAENDHNGETIDPREDLVKKLVEYKTFKLLAEHLKTFEVKNVYTRQPQSSVISIFKDNNNYDTEKMLKPLSMEKLFLIFKETMERKELKVDKVRASFKKIEKETYSVENRMEFIRLKISHKNKVSFKALFEEYDYDSKNEIISTFLAVLELIKLKEIKIMQFENFGDIEISGF